jgi:hypothetical protein
MTVGELIKQLSKLPSTKEVVVRLDDNGEYLSKIEYIVKGMSTDFEGNEVEYVEITPKATLPTPTKQIELIGG